MMGILQRLATAITIISHRKKGITQQPPPKHKKANNVYKIGLTISNVSYIL